METIKNIIDTIVSFMTSIFSKIGKRYKSTKLKNNFTKCKDWVVDKFNPINIFESGKSIFRKFKTKVKS